jgi:hypothetical protein
VHIKLEIQSNLEFQSLTSSPIQSPRPPWIQIDVHGAYKIGFRLSTYARKEDEIDFQWHLSQVQLKSDLTKIAKTISISRVHLVQELFTLKLMPISHMTCNWGILGLHGNLRR